MELLEDANDARLKPRLLQSLVRDRLPDEKRAFPAPSQLSSVLSLVRAHALLSESLPPAIPVPDKLTAAWAAAVDAWVNRCLALSASNMAEKRWTGICLLGLTCEMCAPDRFLRSYSVWFQALLSNIQPPEGSRLVKLASCASMSDLFTRLSRFANVNKDATSLASKLTQPVLQLLSDDGTDAMTVGALDLLGTLLSLFPFSIRRHYEKAEAAVVSKIMSEKYSAGTYKKLAHCLALLAKVSGDADSWITMMHKVLISIDMHLTCAFRGLEEETRSTELQRLLVPPGKDPPSAMGGQSLSSEALEQATKRTQEVLVPRVCTLMRCCCIMITYPHPVQVTFPVRPLISLVERVLSVDGSLHEAHASFTSELHQERICSELPSLHLNCLDLLTAVIKALRSQLLPHAANVTRILMDYFKGATLPCLRIKVYSIVQVLFTSMGVGMALYLAEEVINNTFADLNPFSNENRSGSSNLDHSKVAGESTMHVSSRKRKHDSGAPKEQIGVDVGKESFNRNLTTPLSVQIAALGTLEALVTVAGSLRAECWRPDVDKLLIMVATNACSVGWANEKRNDMLEWESSSTRVDFQLAALQALLASLLSHAYVRPPYLSRGLELFRRGKQEIGTKIASFCTHAMLALEVLIHPRSLPLTDCPVTENLGLNEVPDHQPYSMFPSRLKSNLLPFSRDSDRAIKDFGLSDDDNGEETAVGLADAGDHIEVDISGTAVEVPFPEGVPMVTSVNSHHVSEGSCDPIYAADMDLTSCGQDENAVNVRETTEPVFNDSINVLAGDKTLSCQGVILSDISDGKDIALHILKGDAPDKADIHKDVNARGSLVSNEGKKTSYDSDSPSLDSLPDIVDADPDSD